MSNRRSDQDTPDIIGKSEAINRIRKMIREVGPTDSNVLIQGESGTGKELVARRLHLEGHGSEDSFYPINCSALPETLFESELFGHKKGSFTGAHEDRDGMIVRSSEGTLFLDEISEMSSPGQAKLLRAIEKGEVKPVGSEETVIATPRIVAAGNKELEKCVEAGIFREDLYYRINVIEITIPPLRERREDIPLLIEFMLDNLAEKFNRSSIEISSDAIKQLISYDWPGNVRQLQNVLERAVILTEEGEPVQSPHLPDVIRSLRTESDDETSLKEVVSDFEKAYIQYILQKEGGNKEQTAERLGISRSTLYRKLDSSS